MDLLFFTGKQGGTETVAREIYGRLPSDRGWEFVGYASSELAEAGAPWFPGRLVDSGLRTTSRAQWAWGEVQGVARAARHHGADLIHSPANFGPFRTSVPLVVTLHDMLAHKRPEFLPSRSGAIPTKVLITGAARAASHIITVSESASADIQSILRIPRERISVVRPGSSGAAAASEPAERERGRIFSLGNRMPHKNFPRLVEALSHIPEADRPRLTISGSHGADPLTEVVSRFGLEEWVDLRGWLTREELDGLYDTSTAVVFPTLFEGFGLPVLEAMERGCPVLCSDLPVLREVGGNAVEYFDPEDPRAIASAISNALGDPARLSRLASEGLVRAEAFDWQTSADETLAVFDRVAAATR